MIKLLIVDDEQIEREGLQTILQKAYPELVIEQAKNGNMAVQMAGEFKPNLILMDIKMPGMNGLEAVERISTAYPDIKYVMVTAYDTFDYARLSIKLGVKDYLLKPSKAKRYRYDRWESPESDRSRAGVACHQQTSTGSPSKSIDPR